MKQHRRCYGKTKVPILKYLGVTPECRDIKKKNPKMMFRTYKVLNTDFSLQVWVF